MTETTKTDRKPLVFVGNSRAELVSLPDQVVHNFGYALDSVQKGEMPANAKPMKGFGGAGVVEIVESDAAGTYRAVYTTRLRDTVYVLHAFQKKSRRGIQTDPRNIATIQRRLKEAEELHGAAQTQED